MHLFKHDKLCLVRSTQTCFWPTTRFMNLNVLLCLFSFMIGLACQQLCVAPNLYPFLCDHLNMHGAANPFLPTVPTFAVRETDVSRHNGGTLGAPLKPSETLVL